MYGLMRYLDKEEGQDHVTSSEGGEPVVVLRASDPHAIYAVLAYAEAIFSAGGRTEHCEQLWKHASKMMAWRKANVT